MFPKPGPSELAPPRACHCPYAKKFSSALSWLLVLAALNVGLLGCSRVESRHRGTSTSSSLAPNPAGQKTALDDYVAAPDTNYNFKLVKTIPAREHTAFILEMTSQAWLTTNEVDRPLWKHWLYLVRPNKIESTNSLLFISGGNNRDTSPKGPDDNLIQLALLTRSVVTDLKMIPNQPLTFAGETKGRSEDSFIAYTWDKFLRTGDRKWPARLPMTKAAVRAMDTVTAFCGSAEGGNHPVTGFVVAGGSKRGWTTWTTAAVDKRVIAVAPIVIDMLNIEPSFLHHYAAYGFWAPAVGDYTAFNIMEWTGSPEYRALMLIEEPFSYRNRLTMPKYMINASGDQFFLPDSAQFYFKDLPGQKYLRYVPNADHSLKGTDAFFSLSAYYNAILYHIPLPRFTWKLEKDGAIQVDTKDAPSQVTLWQATNPNARDFRVETFGTNWHSSLLTDLGGGKYLAKVSQPPRGWTAFFAELTYPSRLPQAPFKFTTQVRVVPDVLPYKFVPKGRPE